MVFKGLKWKVASKVRLWRLNSFSSGPDGVWALQIDGTALVNVIRYVAKVSFPGGGMQRTEVTTCFDCPELF